MPAGRESLRCEDGRLKFRGGPPFVSTPRGLAAARRLSARLRAVRLAPAREAAPQAKLIWCSSTGTISDNLIPRFPLYLSNCQKFNAAAAKVMQEENIPINDLYSLLQPRIREVISGDHIHFQEAAKEEIADFLAPKILEALPQR